MPSKERFTVSHEGMREQHAGRAPWELVKELVQNAWDEAPEATVCRINIESTGPGYTSITVCDDGPGFADITDAYTLLKSTPKRRDPTKRGRFNLGEKEFISVALTARVDTVGHTVIFPKNGGRRSSRNESTRGTTVQGTMPWKAEEAQELHDRLTMFRPTDCRLVVNGQEVCKRDPALTYEALLESVLQDGPGEPIRRTRRKTQVDLLDRHDPNQSWLYEMGIPIQPIETPWDIDVQQKVPMPPNRTEVPTRYVNAIYATTLNAAYHLMDRDEFGQNWVKIAMNEERTHQDSVIATVQGRHGDKVLFTSNDKDANMQASEQGYELVNPKSLTPTERTRFRDDGGVQSARDIFGVSYDEREEVEPDPEHEPFIHWVTELGTACGLQVDVKFVRFQSNRANVIADCTADSMKPTIRFNRHHLADDFFVPPFNRADQLKLIMHEFGHAIAKRGMEHGPRWGDGVATAGARIALHLLPKEL